MMIPWPVDLLLYTGQKRLLSGGWEGNIKQHKNLLMIKTFVLVCDLSDAPKIS